MNVSGNNLVFGIELDLQDRIKRSQDQEDPTVEESKKLIDELKQIDLPETNDIKQIKAQFSKIEELERKSNDILQRKQILTARQNGTVHDLDQTTEVNQMQLQASEGPMQATSQIRHVVDLLDESFDVDTITQMQFGKHKEVQVGQKDGFKAVNNPERASIKANKMTDCLKLAMKQKI